MWHLIALSTAILAIFIAGCSSTAPGDEDSRCVNQRTQPYPENVKVLMDSRNYEQLLPGHAATPIAGAVWSDVSCDSNDDVPSAFSTPPYWQHGTGGLCAYQAQVCGYVADSGPQNNSLFTQYISKALPQTAADTYTVRVYVNITYTFLSCRVRANCREEFLLENYITNSEQQRLTCNQRGHFNGDAIIPNNVIRKSSNGETSTTRYFDMTTDQDGFYFAFQDIGSDDLRGTCVAISRLIIYRHECRAQAVGLVRYPTTQAPTSGTESVTTQCVPNAQKSSSSLDVMCSSDGYWSSERPTCQCNIGYQMATNGDGNQVCEACQVGTYRSSSDTTCQSCPANTLKNQIATGQCPCQIGYFRNSITQDNACSRHLSASNESAGSQCTKPPSYPNGVTVSALPSRKMSVSWSRPSQSGGRSDLYYTVQHSDPDTLGQFIGTTCLSSSATSHTYTDLRPGTQYCIRVTAHNGVSDQDAAGTSSRTVQKCETTRLEPPSPVTGFRVFYPVVLWEPPADSGMISNYEVTFSRGEQSNTLTSVLPHFVIQSGNVPGDSGNFTVQVKARNSAGLGQGLSGGPHSVSDGSKCPTNKLPTTTNLTKPGAVSVSNITVLGCGIVGWKPPADTGGEMPGYAIRFFDGQSYETSRYREIQRYFDDPNRRWAVAANLPSGRTVYADIRARNSAGDGLYSVKKIVADSTLCPPDPAPPTTGTCPTTPTCPTTSAPPTCPTVTCPTCPTTPTCQPPPDCPTTATPSECPTVTCPSPPTVTSPGAVSVSNITVLGCGIVSWKPPANTGGEMPGYAIRFFDGQTYENSLYKEIQRYFDVPNRRWAVAANLPSGRTVYVDIRAKNSAGSSSFSEKKLVADSTLCPQDPEPPTCPACPPTTTCPPPTICPTVTCPSCPPLITCPTCQPPPLCPTTATPSSVTPPGEVSVSNITVLGCGIVSWKPPANIGGEVPGYAIRFFDGSTYPTSQYKEIHRHFDDPNRRWAVAKHLPSSRTVYVDIRAKNSGGDGPFSEKKMITNSTSCPTDPERPTAPPTCPTSSCPTIKCPTVATECPFCPLTCSPPSDYPISTAPTTTNNNTTTAPTDCPFPLFPAPEMNVALHVGVLHLTWNPVALVQKYDVIFKEKPEEKGEIHRTISNKTVARINLEAIMKYKEILVEVIPRHPNHSVVKRSTLNYTSEPVKIDVKQIVNTLKDEGELKLALGQPTDTCVDGTSIAISMLVTFLVTAAIMSFLAISLGLLLHRYYSKKQSAHMNGKFKTTQKTNS